MASRTRNSAEPGQPRSPRLRLRLAAGVAIAVLGAPLLAAAGDDPSRLGDLSIEQLMNESVTTLSGKKESLFDAAAAMWVLSSDDLRRSGVSSVADALRLVPGLDVASVNASEWAVSARGFNNLYANKLLVLVDGRSVYTPVFAGVYWDLQQMVLEDIDRIEVIRGPGATVWGANAVNGVVNIVTRSTRDTQGELVYGGAGDVRQAVGGVRHGGRIGAHTHYRAFAGYQRTADFPSADGADAGDGWRGGQGGFRIDRELPAHSRLTWQADATLLDLADGTADSANLNTVGRWTHQWSPGSSLEVQGYFDHTARDEPQRARAAVDTADLGFRHRIALGRNDLIWGLGYRYAAGSAEQTNAAVQIREGAFHLQLLSGFVQKEFAWTNRLSLTSGVKLEHNDFTGIEFQPSLRLRFKPAADQTLWAAVSRAVRTPSVVEGGNVATIAVGAPFTGPGGGQYVPTVVGNPSIRSEVLWAYEVGYRIRPAETVTVDLATFYNRYHDLIDVGTTATFTPGNPGTAEVVFENARKGETYGAETAMTYAATADWRLTGAYSLLLMRIDAQAGADDPEEGSPRHQASLRSSHELPALGGVDAQLRYVSAIRAVPAYWAADLRWSYRPIDRLECALVGQNLLDGQHPEQAGQLFAVSSEVPRGVYAKLTWHF